jgi:SAM-dependent methyltransferase
MDTALLLWVANPLLRAVREMLFPAVLLAATRPRPHPGGQCESVALERARAHQEAASGLAEALVASDDMHPSIRPNDPWPSEELEVVEVGPVCGESRCHVLFDDISDRAFRGAPRKWRVVECAGCERSYLDPRATEVSIHLAYRLYSTHGRVQPPTPLPDWRRRLRGRLRGAYLADTHGRNHRPRRNLGNGVVPPLVPLRRGLDRLARLFASATGRNLLDMSCGSGRFVAIARDLRWSVKEQDPNAAAAQAARESSVDVTLGWVPEAPFAGRVLLRRDLEPHHRAHPRPAREPHRLLRPGGMIWLSTPNLHGFGRLRYGRNWVSLIWPRHLVLLIHGSFEAKLETAGFVHATCGRLHLSDHRTSFALRLDMDPWQHVEVEKVGDFRSRGGCAWSRWPARQTRLS